MPFVQLAELKVYYERHDVADSGVPLLFISGTGGDLRNKPNQFDSPLAQAFDLISYDQRGLGQTVGPAAEYTMQDYADDAARLLDFLGLDQVPVMGVSFGGMVAQEFMLRHPDRVQLAVLACTSAGGAGGASFPLHELAELPAAERVSRQLRVADLRHTDDWIDSHPAQWQQRMDLALQNQRADRDEAGALRQLQARAQHDTFDRLHAITQPVLLAGGELDGIAPAANMQAMAARLPQAELQFFAGGHMFLIQDKTAYPYIIQWFRERL